MGLWGKQLNNKSYLQNRLMYTSELIPPQAHYLFVIPIERYIFIRFILSDNISIILIGRRKMYERQLFFYVPLNENHVCMIHLRGSADTIRFFNRIRTDSQPLGDSTNELHRSNPMIGIEPITLPRR